VRVHKKAAHHPTKSMIKNKAESVVRLLAASVAGDVFKSSNISCGGTHQNIM